MRLGVNLLCAAGFIEAGSPLFALATEAGYDGVEIPILEGEPAHYQRLGAELDRLGLARTAVAVIPSPEANPVSPDPEIRARGGAHLDWALNCALALGAESLGGPLHAPLGHFTGAGPTEEELARGAEAHRRLAERAGAGAIILSLEPLNRFETYFLNTAEQARAYAARVDHPAFRIMYDTFHAHIEERDQPSAVRELSGLIGVLHVSENDRGAPGRGQIDFERVFGAARSTGFDDWLVIEAFGGGLPELAAATRVWRPLFPDLETLFHEGGAFVRRAWARAGQ